MEHCYSLHCLHLCAIEQDIDRPALRNALSFHVRMGIDLHRRRTERFRLGGAARNARRWLRSNEVRKFTVSIELFPCRMHPAQSALRTARQRRPVREDLPLRTPRRGSGKSEHICEGMDLDIELPTPAFATAPAKDGFGRFRVSAACGADLSCLCRASLPLSLPWAWHRLSVAVPIQPSPAIPGRRA